MFWDVWDVQLRPCWPTKTFPQQLETPLKLHQQCLARLHFGLRLNGLLTAYISKWAVERSELGFFLSEGINR